MGLGTKISLHRLWTIINMNGTIFYERGVAGVHSVPARVSLADFLDFQASKRLC